MDTELLRIKVSRIFGKIRRSKKRVTVLEGSSRSTKTFSIIQWIISQHNETEGLTTTVCRARLTWLKASIIPDFIDVLKMHGQWNEKDFNKTESTYSINGGLVRFIGLDESQKMHGLKQDICWINEAVEATKKAFTQLIIRTKKRIILDYNPSYEDHWIYSSVVTRDDCEFIHSTYKDNPFLDPAIRAEIEKLEPTEFNIAQGTADETAWKIYGLGLRAAHKGLIMAKMKICKDLPPESEWTKVMYGLDFGFTNDPTALVKIVMAHGNLYFKELIYKKGLTNIINPNNPSQLSIEQLFIDLGIPKDVEIFADSAEPKSIADLKGCGYNIKPVEKGPDSVKAGIDTMLRYNLFITEDSMNGIKEKNNYKWNESSEGKLTNTPIDLWNHFMDAGRYAVYMALRERTGNFADLMRGLNL